MKKILCNLDDFLKLCKSVETPVVGVGMTAFNRLGPEQFLSNYYIIALHKSKDIDLIKKQTSIYCLAKYHDEIRKNTQGILKHPKTEEIINSFRDPYLFIYMVSHNIAKVCTRNQWKFIGIESKREDKIGFRKMLKVCNLPRIPGKVISLSKLRFKTLQKKYGDFVLQIPGRGGGKGTFFIFSERDFNRTVSLIKKDYQNPKIVLTKFIKGYSPSITCCVTQSGVVYTNPQHQLTDIPEIMRITGAGMFCGHDWSASVFPRKVRHQIYHFAEKIGAYLKNQGYKGVFGLDFVVDSKTQKVYAVECNPRLLGSMPALTMIQINAQEIPLVGLHVLEFLGVKYKLNLACVNKLVQQPKTGAQLLLSNKARTYMRVTGSLRAGVYQFHKKKLEFIRSGYDIAAIQNKDEFLVADGVPYVGARYKPGARMLRILTKQSVYDFDKKELLPWARQAVKAVYKALNLKHARTPKRGTILFRTYKPSDWEAIKKLNALTSRDAFVSYQDIHTPIRAIQKKYFDDGGTFFVAENTKTNTIIGMVGVRFLKDGKRAKVKALRVSPKYRRRGIAYQLMQLAEEYAKENGRAEIVFGAAAKAIPAIRLYQKLGYIVDYQKEVVKGVPAIFFRKEI